MQVVRQNHEGVDMERVSQPRLARGVPKSLDVIGKKASATVEEIDGKEPAATGDKGATVVRHVRKVAKSCVPFTPLLRVSA